MSLRRSTLAVAAVCGLVFLAVMAWDLGVQRPRLTGSQMCVQDATTAQSLQLPGTGVFKFDRTSGAAVRIPPSMALGMILSTHSSYPGYRTCGLTALRQTWPGLVTMASLAGALISGIAALFLRRR